MSEEPKKTKKLPKKKKSNLKYWVSAGIFVLMIKACNSDKSTKVAEQSDDNQQTVTEAEAIATNTAEKPVEPPKPVSTIPEDQKSFLKVITDAQAKAKAAQNDMQKGGIKAEREAAVCELTKSGLFVQNWEGTVANLDSTAEGAGILAIEIAQGILVQTAEIELGVQMDGDDPSTLDFTKNNVKNEKSTMLDPSSDLFKKVAQLKEGQKVKFSGEFLKGEDGDCLEELSLTLDGKLSEPQYIMRFSSVEPI